MLLVGSDSTAHAKHYGNEIKPPSVIIFDGEISSLLAHDTSLRLLYPFMHHRHYHDDGIPDISKTAATVECLLNTEDADWDLPFGSPRTEIVRPEPRGPANFIFAQR